MSTSIRAGFALVSCLSFVGVAELPNAAAAGAVQACSLINRDDVRQATGADPFVDPESAAGGAICNVGTGELKLYAGPDSWQAWETTRKSFQQDKVPTTPVSGLGKRAYVFYPTPRNSYQGNVAFLVVESGDYTLALSLDAPEGKPAESMRPALESLMKVVLARLK